MSREKKIARYLREANGMEKALTDVLTSQIAMTPRGAHRKALQLHLRQTRDHAKRVQRRLAQLDHGGNPIELGVGLLQNVVGQALGLGRMPFDLLRGRGGEERLLNNAKDNCAAEAREIAMYTAIERLARSLGDAQTAKLAASIRNDEQRMLDVLLSEIPTLTEAIVSAEVRRKPPRAKTPRVVQAERSATRRTRPAAHARAAAKSSSGKARRTAKRAPRPAPTVVGTRIAKRSMPQPVPTSAPGTARPGAEPWPGHDEKSADQIAASIHREPAMGVGGVDSHEREHDARSGAVNVAEREHQSAIGAPYVAERELAST